MIDVCIIDFKILCEILILFNNGERLKCWSECFEESFM